MLLVMILAYCLLTEFPPVGAIKVTENRVGVCAYASLRRTGTAVDAVT
jgi:hypothetical protein